MHHVIVTKYLSCTNKKPSRIKAWFTNRPKTQITVSYGNVTRRGIPVSGQETHFAVAEMLQIKDKSPGKLLQGWLSDSQYVFLIK